MYVNLSDEDDDGVVIAAPKRRKQLRNTQPHYEFLKRTERKLPEIVMNNDNTIKVDGDTSIPSFLATKMFSYQILGTLFLWENLIKLETGCILADSMGLGKTLQTIAFIYCFFMKFRNATILILSPAVVIDHWENEISKWLGQEWTIFRVGDEERWARDGGIMIIGYEMFTLSVKANEKSPLLDTNIVICDEGHRIKSHKIQIFKALGLIKSTGRACLTGYPLQNNLYEYRCMLSFIAPFEIIFDKMFFVSFFQRPIENGMCIDSNRSDIALMKKRSYILHEEIKRYVLRRNETILTNQLPKKNEYVILLRMKIFQNFVYRAIIEMGKCNHLFDLFNKCSLALVHPKIIERQMALNTEENQECLEQIRNHEDYGDDYNLSTKMIALMEIVRLCIKEEKEKIVIFSGHLKTLDYIESILSETDDSDYIYQRMDGKTPMKERTRLIRNFSTDNPNIFLISTRSGGVGINLVAANRVILVDPCWNPCHDVEATYRTWRFGQKKTCYVYRLLMNGTCEEKVYRRQVQKQSLFSRIVDKKPTIRHYSNNDLARIFDCSYQENGFLEDTEIDDNLLQTFKSNYNEMISSIYRHDSLLNEVHEELTEDDKCAAIEDYNGHPSTGSAAISVPVVDIGPAIERQRPKVSPPKTLKRTDIEDMRGLGWKNMANKMASAGTGIGSLIYHPELFGYTIQEVNQMLKDEKDVDSKQNTIDLDEESDYDESSIIDISDDDALSCTMIDKNV